MENKVETSYLLVQTREQFQAVIEQCEKSSIFAVDLETTGVNRFDDYIVGLSVSWAEGHAAYVPIAHLDGNVSFPVINLAMDEWSQKVKGIKFQPIDVTDPLYVQFKQLLETHPSVPHNAKFEKGMLLKYGINLKYTHDTLIQCYLTGKFEMQGDRLKNGLKDAVKMIFDHDMTHIEELFTAKKVAKSDDIHMEQLAAKEAYMYGCADADWTLRLHHRLSPQFQNTPREFIYAVEMNLIDVVYRMENVGIRIDEKYFKEKSVEFTAAAAKIQELIYDQASQVAGERVVFNINKPADVGKVLYEMMKLPVLERTEKTNAPSTSEETLNELAKQAPIAKNILSWRQLTKRVTGNFDKLPLYTNNPDGRVHSDLMQAHASSGRFASKNPNLQNQPKYDKWQVLDNQGNSVFELECNIRKGFIPADGYYFIEADYSQVEFRIFMGEAQEHNALRSFAKGIDAHTATASVLFNIPPEVIEEGIASGDIRYKKMRGDGKTVNFGMLYGQGPRSLSIQLGITEEKARQFYDTYFSQKPAVQLYIQRQKDLARRRKYIETHFGRPRYIAGLNMEGNDRKTMAIKSIAEREAVNTIIQGSAADLLKIALVRTDKILTKYFAGRIRMVLTVHDSILFEVPKDIDPAEAIEKIRIGMELVVEGWPAIIADFSVGDSWGNLKSLKAADKVQSASVVASETSTPVASVSTKVEPTIPRQSVASRIGMVIHGEISEEQWSRAVKVLKDNPGNNLFVVKLPDGDHELSNYMTSLGVEDRGLFKSIISCDLFADQTTLDSKTFMSGVKVHS